MDTIQITQAIRGLRLMTVGGLREKYIEVFREAIRSATFASMSLLVAAIEMGLDAGVVVGFDADAVSKTFGLEANELPVVLVTIGRA